MPLGIHDWVVMGGLPWVKLSPFPQKLIEITCVRAPALPCGCARDRLPQFLSEAPCCLYRCGTAWSDAPSASGPLVPWKRLTVCSGSRKESGARRRGLDRPDTGKDEGPGGKVKEAWQWGGPGHYCLLCHFSVRRPWRRHLTRSPSALLCKQE